MRTVRTTLAHSVDGNDTCGNQETDDDGRDEENGVSAHVNLLATSRQTDSRPRTDHRQDGDAGRREAFVWPTDAPLLRRVTGEKRA
jgi:hypothetical protein